MTDERKRHGGKFGKLLDIERDICAAILGATEDADNLADEYNDAAEAMRESFPDSEKADEYDDIAATLNEWAEELRDIERPSDSR